MEDNAQYAADGGGGGIFSTLVTLAFIVFVIASMWKVFTKAGQPGWASIVPFYNLVVMLKIAGKPVWWLVLFFIPFVNFVIAILTYIALAKSFGKGVGFGLGLTFLAPIFFPILAFGDAQYVGPEGNPQGYGGMRAA